MNKSTATGEPATELERLIAELSESGLLVFVFGVGWWTAHLTGATRPLFRGPADRRWWHVELGNDAERSATAQTLATREITATPRQPDTPVQLRIGRLAHCASRPSKLGVNAAQGRGMTATRRVWQDLS